ncbi:unnamed protein product [Urochloa humidicola]
MVLTRQAARGKLFKYLVDGISSDEEVDEEILMEGPDRLPVQQPPPEAMAGMEPFLQAQMTLLQNLTNTVAGLQAQINNGVNQQNQNLPPRDKHREFMSHRPP